MGDQFSTLREILVRFNLVTRKI